MELELGRVKKPSKQQKNDIEDLDELEQYTRKNSLKFHAIPEDVGIPTDEIVCEVEPEKIKISHLLKQEKRNQTNNCKIC